MIENLDNIGPQVAEKMAEKGYVMVDDVDFDDLRDLQRIDYLSTAKLARIMYMKGKLENI